MRFAANTLVEPLSILLVEDDPAHAELVRRCFEDHRIVNQIHHVSDGKAALAYLFRQGDYADPAQSPRPHVVLLDLRLPKVDGLEVLQQIRTSEELQAIPVVVLSTSGAERDVAQAYAWHANSYLVKPPDFAQFVQLMETLGYYWLRWNYYPWS